MHIKLNLIYLFCGLILWGCTTPYTPPQNYSFNNEKILNQSYDRVWSRLMEICIEMNFPLKLVDKYSSVIQTQPINFNNDGLFCDCGKPGSGFGWYGKIANPVGYLSAALTRIDESRTKVKIVFHFFTNYNIYEMNFNTSQYYLAKTIGFECNSTGQIEQILLKALGD